jgi:hypothetical protein
MYNLLLKNPLSFLLLLSPKMKWGLAPVAPKDTSTQPVGTKLMFTSLEHYSKYMENQMIHFHQFFKNKLSTVVHSYIMVFKGDMAMLSSVLMH